MYERVLRQLQEKIRTNDYIMTLHAEEEMNDEDLSIFDVERILLAGEIVERQRDAATAESKYRIKGETVSGIEGEVIAKMGPTGKPVIITVYAS